MPDTPMPPEHFEIDIAVNDPRWEAVVDALPLPPDEVCRAVIGRAAPPGFAPEFVELSLVLCDDAEIQTLNRDYRGKDKATNVLSFPQIDWEAAEAIPLCNLGDVVMAYDTIAREAQEQDKNIHNHFLHMLVHGILHLLGYDHINPQEAEEMEALEIQILQQWDINNPYET